MYASPSDDTALPPPPPARPARRPSEARRGVRRLVSRFFFGASAAAAAATAAGLALGPEAIAFDRRLLPLGAFALLALICLVAMRSRGAWIERAMFGVLAFATLAIAGSALGLGWGLATPGLGLYGLFVGLLFAAGGRRMGLALAGVAALALLGVAALAWGRGPGGGPGDALWLAAHGTGLAVGTAGGVLVSWVVARYVRSADDREQRFRGLLGLAADAYWEIDAQYRVVAILDPRDEERSAELAEAIDQVPWELPQFGCDADTLDALMADLDGRHPFHDRLVHWDDGEQVRALRISGEPRFDERGAFTGFWGVARDVSAERAARQALAETEWRWQELFARIPTPLVVHRDGRILDANPAAAALFAGPGTSLAGRDWLALVEPGDSRDRERRRIEQLAIEPPGAALPVAEARLIGRDGRRLLARTAAVRLEARGEPLTMTMVVDDTDRRSAEEAVRRSETLLAHLVATSPDVIALIETDSDRLAMVNRAFERVTGWSSAQAVSHTATEVGLWPDATTRERFIADLRSHGSVGELPMQITTRGGRPLVLRVSGARFALDRRDYIVLNARDVTDAERLRLEREAILEHASIGIALTRQRRILMANPAIEEVLGWPRGGLAGQSSRVAWPSDAAYEAAAAEVTPRLAAGEPVEIEHALVRRDGTQRLCRLLARPVDPSGQPDGSVIWIIEDITERRLAEQALAAARDAAEAASRAKSAFLANTSHELRTPLNGLLNLALLARDPATDAGRRERYLNQIVESAQGLAGIISDILDLSKIEAGRVELEDTVFDLGELLRAIERSYATLAEARDLSLRLDLADEAGGPVRGDPLRLRQILGNYLGNALKFTSTGGVVLVVRRREELHGSVVRFEVHDTGPGIDAKTQARLFQPFTQADESTTRRFGGTGLGLSICRELALAMGGRVGVASEPGRGSCFWAELPLQPAPAQAPAVPRAPLRDLRGLRVLMVEDNPVNMMIAVALLERWGIAVEQSVDGRQALDAVRRAADAGQAFDAVLMDVQMPVMSGHEAARELRQQPWGQRVPIIALTAAALVTERQAALDAGMDDFLTKPIDAERLREALARWAGSERGLA